MKRDKSEEDAEIRRTLSRIARNSALGVTWQDQVKMLRHKENRTVEDWQTLARTCREVGSLPEDACFFQIVWAIGWDAQTWKDAIYERDFANRLEALNKAHGLAEDEFFSLDDQPDDYRALDAEYEQATDQIMVEMFQRYGEYEIADLYEKDRPEYDRRAEAGRYFFFGPLPEEPTTGTGGQAK